jgi:hypothetical protein
MPGFVYSDGRPVEVGDRVALEDRQWRGVVEQCFEAPHAGWPGERGVLVRYDEVGLVFYPDGVEQDAVLIARRGNSPAPKS